MYGYVFRKKYEKRQPRRLRKLEIAEVSSVTAAANEHAKILIMKSSSEKEPDTVQSAIMKLDRDFGGACVQMTEFAKCNEISSHTFSDFIKHAACTAFPLEKSEGAAMAKFFETVRGREMLHVHVAMPTLHEARVMNRLDPTVCKYADDDGRPGEENRPTEHVDETGQADPAANRSPYYTELARRADTFSRSKEGRELKLSPQAAFVHLCENDADAKELLDKDLAWERSRMNLHAGTECTGALTAWAGAASVTPRSSGLKLWLSKVMARTPSPQC